MWFQIIFIYVIRPIINGGINFWNYLLLLEKTNLYIIIKMYTQILSEIVRTIFEILVFKHYPLVWESIKKKMLESYLKQKKVSSVSVRPFRSYPARSWESHFFVLACHCACFSNFIRSPESSERNKTLQYLEKVGSICIRSPETNE